MEEILKIIFVAVISSVKFVVGAPTALAYELGYFETLSITTIGGILGVFFFFFFSQWLLKVISEYKNKMFFLFGINAKPSKKNVFNWRNRMIVKVVRNFGLIGVAAITPALLSIPLGTFIATRYFRDKRKVVAYLCLSVVFWGFIFSSVVVLF